MLDLLRLREKRVVGPFERGVHDAVVDIDLVDDCRPRPGPAAPAAIRPDV